MRAGSDLAGAGGLPSPWRDDPLLAGEHARSRIARWWADEDGIVLVLDLGERPSAAIGLGTGPAVAALLDAAAGQDAALLGRCVAVSLPRGAWDLLGTAGVALPGVDGASTWDWMCTRAPLDAPRRETVVRLPPGQTTVDRVRACLERAHPEAGTPADDRRALGWWGVEDGDRLVAVVGATPPANGPTPRLVSLGVDPDARGRGLAGEVLAAAVDDLLPGSVAGAVSIALYASNHVARGVYLRHGFELRHAFETRRRSS